MRTATTMQHETAPEGEAFVMSMLAQHVPLALLIDLRDPKGPVSAEILESEGVPDTRWWEA